jgi:quercetin dioxygenase-like cupin family protein
MAVVNRPVPGIALVEDIFAQSGVDTLEGRIGPLLSGARAACHFIELQPGQYLDEHPHATESLIFAAKGDFVLCSQGERWHIKEGTLFWFGDNVPTGWEAPFPTPATILIFKSQPRDEAGDEEFVRYLEDMAAGISKEHAAGTPFRLDELPQDHPARKFAAQLGAPVS